MEKNDASTTFRLDEIQYFVDLLFKFKTDVSTVLIYLNHKHPGVLKVALNELDKVGEFTEDIQLVTQGLGTLLGKLEEPAPMELRGGDIEKPVTS